MKRADHHLVQQVLDGDVSQEVFRNFQHRLRKEPELKKLYQEYALLQHVISEEFEGKLGGEMKPELSMQRSFGFPLALVAIAALACIAALGFYQPWNSEKEPVDAAVLTFSVDAVWRIDGSSRVIGGATGVADGSVLHLAKGRAGISINPAVTAIVEGPAALRFLSNEALYMTEGRAFFNRGTTGGGLTLTTPRLTEVNVGTRFGIEVSADGPDGVFVADGEVQIVSRATAETALLAAGEAAEIPSNGPIRRFQATGKPFAKNLGKFKTVFSTPFDRTQWRLDFGNPTISDYRIDGENYAAFHRFPEAVPGPTSSVLLATLDVGNPSQGEFHTDGWAGMSFFSNGVESLFFGDPYGTKMTWYLDVKQRVPVILPENPVAGPRVVTLRYDRRSGEVSLHEGGLPLGQPICSGKITPGTVFHEIRLGASSAAALAVKSLTIRENDE